MARAITEGGTGVPNGAVLSQYAAAAHDDPGPAAGSQLRSDLGGAAFIEAAATVAIFNGLVRTADSSGIPLDDGTAAFSVEHRDRLGLNDFGGAASTDLSSTTDAPFEATDLDQLFSARFR